MVTRVEIGARPSIGENLSWFNKTEECVMYFKIKFSEPILNYFSQYPKLCAAGPVEIAQKAI